MKLVRQTKLAFLEGSSDKVYEVDLCETGDKFTVNFRYGRRGAELKEGTKTPSAVGLEEAEKIFQKLVDEKTRKGYHEIGGAKAEAARGSVDLTYNAPERDAEIVKKLAAPKASSHPKIDRAIWRAGELEIKEAAALIVNFIGTAKELRDYCCAWALGLCGDRETLGALEKLSEHKNEAVRRIAFEARLKLLGDPQILLEERFRKLPDDAQKILQKTASVEIANENLRGFLKKSIENHKRGELKVLEEIYTIAPPELRPAIVETLRTIPTKAKFFKTLRHIFKIAEYRRDAEIYGVIARRFEAEKSNFSRPYWGDRLYFYDENGNWSNVNYKEELKKDDATLAFSNLTKTYLMRRSWRTLRRLGEIGDDNYVKMAVGALLAYRDADAIQPYSTEIYDYHHTGAWNWQNPKISHIHYDAFAPCLLLNHIIYGNSERYELRPNTYAFRMRENHRAGEPAPAAREEAFPKLWEAQPNGLLHLLSESLCQPVHEFAVKVLKDCGQFTESLDVAAVLMLLSRPYDATARLGFELARKFYDAANPNAELILAVAFSENAAAQTQGFEWIETHRELFVRDGATLLKILTRESQNVRAFGKKLISETVFSAAQAQNLAAILIAELVSYDEAKAEIASDLSDAIFAAFAAQLKTINLSVATDLLKHPLVGVQILGAKILSVHETPAENLPNDLINSLIESPFAEIRRLGIEIFGKLPDENLIRRESVIMNFLTHALEDVHLATRPIVRRLAGKYPAFAETIVNEIFVRLLETEAAENLHSQLYEVLREMPNWTRYADFEVAVLLTKAETSAAQDAGGFILRENADEYASEVSVADLIEFTDNEIVSVRRAAWNFAEKRAENLREEVSDLIRVLDTKFDDSREFWFEFFRTEFTDKELTPDVLVAIADSVKPPVQKLGRDLLLKYFKEENGAEYLLKLSEHPAANMQLFATNYLENHAADAPEKLEKLAPFFIRVFSLVNRARTAKERSLNFLETEALKSERAARIAAAIFARQSATVSVGDRARMIKTMVEIHRKFPFIALPVKIKSAEVRVNAV